MMIKSNIEKALIKFAYLIISRNSQKLAGKYPKVICFSFDFIGNYINCYGRYEDSQLKKLREIVIQQGCGSTALDIGANIGNHSIFFAELFEKVIAFEPNPKTYAVLKINTGHLKNVVCLMIGASSRKATLNFSVNELNMGGSTIVSEDTITDQNNFSQIKIEVWPIDQIDEIRDEKVGLVKIDVEGHEIDVIRGMSDTLRRNKPIIAFEQEAKEIIDGSSVALKELKNVGYNYFYAIECRKSIVSNILPSFLRIPLQLLEIVMLGDVRDTAELYEVKYLDKRQYKMLIASMHPINQKGTQ